MNVYELIISDKEKVALEDVFFSTENKAILNQILKEHQYLEELRVYNLPVDNKILLYGDSGCGKTTTAKAIATALDKPIVILSLSTVISARIGETSKNLKAVFDQAIRQKAVLFLDEFDQIGKMRGNDDKEVGEMRRLVNTIIQLIDYFPLDCLLICATNHHDIIDRALLRRFQLKLRFDMPEEEKLNSYYDKMLAPFPEHLKAIDRKYGVSFAEVKDYVHTTMKKRIILELEQKK
ncbi:AAA family ATPase [Pedobacter steynii]|uniref:ATPase n=1 Tax=Pedobacter steynii TaxID=430522 RepID=A0A1D7QLT1_9SPHI|nr:ATP-binding protein [Pedobacter steynii]AOM79617.1 ATPase [Pedobacter steynii]